MHGEQLYEGKAKQLFLTDDKNTLVQRFKNSVTAFNGEKVSEFAGKGAVNNAISTFCFRRLEDAGLDTHFLSHVNANDMRVKRLEMIPLEIVVRNVVAGSLAKRTGLAEGTEVSPAIVETYFKRDDLHDPILADTHVFMLNILRPEQLSEVKRHALKVNETMQVIFRKAGIILVDFKLEFGWDANNRLVLGDEFSPDTSRLWDVKTGQKLDKDVYRNDLGELMDVYREVARRLDVTVPN